MTARKIQSMAVMAVIAISCLLCCLLLSACAQKPWVRPYDRLNLAQPVMAVDRHPVASSYEHHVYQAREGARGAEGGAGGGCGCN